MTDLGRLAFEKAVEKGAAAIDGLLASAGVDGNERLEFQPYSLSEAIASSVLKVGLVCPFSGTQHEAHAWGSTGCRGEEAPAE